MKSPRAVIAEDEGNLREELRETLSGVWPELAGYDRLELGQEDPQGPPLARIAFRCHAAPFRPHPAGDLSGCGTGHNGPRPG